MKMYIIILFLFLCDVVVSQNPYEQIDDYVDSIEISRDLDFKEIANLLTASLETDQEKVRSIFYWIAKNIEYDKEGLRKKYWDGILNDSIVSEMVLQRRKAICSGYSALTKKMLDEINIDNEIVIGWAKGETYNVLEEEPNHTWNIVMIDNEWKIIDVTWASSRSKSNPVRNYYYFPDPNQFIGTHYPENYEWSLVDEKISHEDFKDLPMVKNSFYEIGFGTSIPKIKRDSNQVSFDIKEPKDVIIGFILHDIKKQQSDIIEYDKERVGEITKIRIKLPDKKEKYKLEMTAIIGDLFTKVFEVVVFKI